MRYCTFIFVFMFCFVHTGHAQVNKHKVDSLYNAYQKVTTDTQKVNILLKIARQYRGKENVKGVSFLREALEISGRIGFDKGICLSASGIAGYYYDQLNYADAMKTYLIAAAAGEKYGEVTELYKIYTGIGIMHSNQGKFEQALRYFLKVSKLAETHHQARELAVSYNNMGICYKNLGRFTEAKKYYTLALGQFKKMNFIRGIASANSNLGIISHVMKDDETALQHYKTAMEAFHSINDTVSEAGIYTNIGELYRDEKQYKKAMEYYQVGLDKAKAFHNVNFMDDAYEGISKLYAETKDYEKAYRYNQLHLALKDSINNEEGMRQVQEMERRLDNEKQEKEIQILKQSKEIQDLKVSSQAAKLKENKVIIYSVIGVLCIVLIMSFFIFNAYREIKRTNRELAEKKKEIQDSINYAKNIQEAMLPDVRILKSHFPEAFGLFMPKDVVSGDFYWFSELNEVIYFAVADCTGHGVPGGFVSMIGIDKLNQALNDKKIEQLGSILSFLNTGIRHALKQAGDSVSRDGMDIALCAFDRRSMVLRYAAANRPLWILRNREIIEHKPTKASIGGYTEDDQQFDEIRITLAKGDVIYLFSDGYADQFGGAGKKKFMSKQLKQVLIDNHEIPMSQQEARFKEIFDGWRGSVAQVDDVLLLGIRI